MAEKCVASYAFLTVTGDPETGYVGGCLVLNNRGRPLEFHCTSPLKPNRAQVILYGPTLRPHIVAECIAQSLIHKSTCRPLILWTDDMDVLALRSHIETPIGVVQGSEAEAPAAAAAPPLRLQEFTVHTHAHHAEDQQAISQRWQSADPWIEIGEPFQRIREAISEAQKAQAKSA